MKELIQNYGEEICYHVTFLLTIPPPGSSAARRDAISWRAHQLSRARASRVPWLLFLAQQSDVILMLCGSPAVWHFVRRRSVARLHMCAANGDRADLIAGVAHQLRQVFTVLLLGLGMLARKAPEGKAADLIILARRLQSVARTGASMLAALDAPTAELAPIATELYHPRLPGNGR